MQDKAAQKRGLEAQRQQDAQEDEEPQRALEKRRRPSEE